MKKLKQSLIVMAMSGFLCILPAAFNPAGAAENPSDSILVLAKGGNGGGSSSGEGSGSAPDTKRASDRQAPSQKQPQFTKRVETRQNAPDEANGQQANRVMENARGTLKQIKEQTMDQARTMEKWQELQGQIDQIKEQAKLRRVTREQAKSMLRECLELAREQQNLEEQENCLKDLIEIDPADKEAYKELGATYRMREKHGVKVFAKGTEINFDVPPVIKEGRTLIPVRATEGLGATVNYDPENQTVTVTKGETTIVLTIGQNVALVNGREVTLDAKAELNNSRTIVPLRFIAETFKLDVDYYPEGEIVTVNDPATGSTAESTSGSDTGTAAGSATEGTTTEGSNTESTATNQ